MAEAYSNEEEKGGFWKSWGVSITVHAILLVIMAFAFRLMPPNPPLSDYGVAVNFGYDEQGFGDVQSYDPAPQGETPDAGAETPNNDPTPAQENVTPPVEETEDNTMTTEEDSPVEIPEKPKPKEEPKPKPEPVKPKPEPEKPKLTQEQIRNMEYGGGGTKPGQPGGSQRGGGSGNEGNDPGKVGNKGNPGGSLDNLNYEGTPGRGGSGARLDMAGWRWALKPNINDETDETGKIVFEIQVDEEGELVNIKTVERTVSPAVERACRAALEKTSFERTAAGSAASISTGRVTFIIRAD